MNKIYLKIQPETVEKIKEITGIDYDFIDNLCPAENIENIIKDLILKIDILNEKDEDKPALLNITF